MNNHIQIVISIKTETPTDDQPISRNIRNNSTYCNKVKLIEIMRGIAKDQYVEDNFLTPSAFEDTFDHKNNIAILFTIE